MSWRERMGPASFRGVPFFVDTAEHSGGRRGVTHEYPFRDQPFREDLGRATRKFTVEGYVIGDEYLAARDLLLRALESPSGPGELVHPYYGTRQVAVIGFRVRESSSEGGVARLSVEFEESPSTPAQPTAVPDAAEQLRTRAESARQSVGLEFLAEYAPGVHTASLAEMVRKVTLAADNALAAVDQDEQTVADLKRKLSVMEERAAALVNVPADVLESLGDFFADVVSGGVRAILAVYDFDPGVRPPATTSNRLVEQEAFDVLQRLTQRLVVVRAAELALVEDWASFDEAVAVRELVTEKLDEQIETVADDAFPALMDLRASLVQAVPGADSDLPRLQPYTPGETLPSLVVAWRLYGAISGEGDIVDRNRVAHPGFVTGGVELEVLSDA